MPKQATAALLLIGGLTIGVIGSAQGQTVPNPTQNATATAPDQGPIFRVTVVGRSTPAINYRPRKGATKVDFVGTPLLPNARGNAEIQGKKGYMEIDARFEKLEPPGRFGSEYLTYVLWAITPEGRATNLGEVQFDDSDARVQVTTELQAFGLVLTAEPYFAVTQPSDVVVIENVVRDNTKGSVDFVTANYQLIKRGSYLMNQDAGRLKVKALDPGAPLDLAEARNAVALAGLAGADRFAAEQFTKASRLLADAEGAREKRKNGNEVMQPARQAVQTAEDARIISLQKQDEAFIADQQAQARQREAEALGRARAEEARRLQADTERLTADAAKVEAQRQQAAAEAAKLAAEQAGAAAQRDRAEAEAARAAAEAARASAETQTQQAQALAAQADHEKAELRNRLREQLNIVLETRETARGLIVNLSDVLFDTGSATLKPGTREKLAKVTGILLSQPNLKIMVEGHTDNVGSDSYNLQLSERRANSVRDYIVGQGIGQNAVGTSGLGESSPVVSNDTAAGRQQNRRVELIVSGDAIGTATH